MTRPAFRSSVLALTSAAVLSLSGAAHAQYFGQNRVQHRTFDMRVLKTEHFDIYYYPEEEQAVRTYAERMAERWYARLSRLLDFKLPDRQPLILYASQPDFQQTNTLGGQEPGEGTGGVTEPFKRRVILPFAGSLGETDHVLGHELVHAFQYAESSRKTTGNIEGPAISRMPLWFVEGMAEYLSVGPVDPHTAMWMRDAVARNKLPRIKDLESAKYFPYRWGQALWAYIGGRWGDPTVGRILAAASRGGGDARGAIERTLGMKIDQLSKEWQDSLKQAYQPLIDRTRATELKPLLGATGRGRMNLSPAVSPDGREVAFLSEKSQFAVELYLADTTSGQVRKRISNAALNPRVDSLMFIYSAGAWDFSGRRFAHPIVDNGRPALVVRDVAKSKVEEEIPLPEMGEVYNPTWSPDGKRIAFSALAGGLTDLYLYDLTTKKVTRLTDDAYSDLQPAWSPDGKTIAFVTDRFTSDLNDLRFGDYRLALIDPDTKQIVPVAGFDKAKNINPQWSKDGGSIYFISDRGGVSDVYRVERSTGALYQVTNIATGVSGLTPLSPALSSASAASRLTFTAYDADRYALFTLDDATALAGKPVESEAPTGPYYGELPPTDRSYDEVASLKRDTNYGLPAPGEFRLTPYHPKLALDYVSQPYIAAGLDRFGSFVGGGTSLSFSDMLGDHNLNITFQANGGFSDIAFLTAYTNLKHRLNWGIFGGQVPYVYGGGVTGLTPDGLFQEQDYIFREIDRQVGIMATYPFSRAQRIETVAGYRRVSFQQEIQTTTFDPAGNVLDYNSKTSSLYPSLDLGEGSVALVYDTSVYGPTSPLLGRAYRFEAGSVVGSLGYRTLLGDVRQYVMPVRPFTLAGRMLFYGRFGSGATDQRLLNSVNLGYPGLVRGYDENSIDLQKECTDTSCPIYDRISGTKLLVGNAELRFPLLGLFGGESYFGPFPIEGALFVDGGAAWTSGHVPKLIGKGHQSVWSIGAALRINVFGFAVVEIDRVKPLDRPQKGAFWQFNFTPGF